MGKAWVPNRAISRKAVPGTWGSKWETQYIFSCSSNIMNGVLYCTVLLELQSIYTKKLKWIGNVFGNNR